MSRPLIRGSVTSGICVLQLGDHEVDVGDGREVTDCKRPVTALDHLL
ncbi:MAG: hypothetical protein ACLP1E_08765 [Acidimicrobiales bacterium]